MEASEIMKAAKSYERKVELYMSACENNYGSYDAEHLVARAENAKWNAYEKLYDLLAEQYGDSYVLRIMDAESRPGGITGLLVKIEAYEAQRELEARQKFETSMKMGFHAPVSL
jgi:hypothetical protein